MKKGNRIIAVSIVEESNKKTIKKLANTSFLTNKSIKVDIDENTAELQSSPAPSQLPSVAS